MKNIITFIITLFITSTFSLGDDTKVSVGKVNYSKIEDLVDKIVLSKPENQEIGVRLRASRKKSEDAQMKMQKAIMKGEKIDPMAAAAEMMGQSGDVKKVEFLCEKYVLELVERVFEGKYQIILKDDYRSSLLYTKIPIDDVTDILRQELLKELPVGDME